MTFQFSLSYSSLHSLHYPLHYHSFTLSFAIPRMAIPKWWKIYLSDCIVMRKSRMTCGHIVFPHRVYLFLILLIKFFHFSTCQRQAKLFQKLIFGDLFEDVVIFLITFRLILPFFYHVYKRLFTNDEHRQSILIAFQAQIY